MSDQGDPGEGDLGERVDRLETGQSQILSKLDELLGSGQRKAQAREEKHLDRPSSVEEQVRMELARAERERAEAAAKEADKSERETLAQRLAKLEEKAPVPLQPRRERVMWGKR